MTSIVNPEYRERMKQPDWLGSVIVDTCSTKETAKDEHGRKTTKQIFDYDLFIETAAQNGVPADEIAKAKKLLKAPENGSKGRVRMSLRNRLQKIAKTAGKLQMPNGKGGWKTVKPPSDWLDENGKPIRGEAA